MQNSRIISRKAVRGLAVFILLYPFFSSIIADKMGFSVWNSADELAIVLMVLLIPILNLGKIVIDQFSKRFFVALFVWSIAGFIPFFTRGVELSILLRGCFFQIKNYLLFYLVYSIPWKEQQLNKIIKILAFIYCLILFFGFLFYYIPSISLFNLPEMSSIFSHQGVFATLIVPVGIYAFFSYINKGGIKYIVSLVIVFICLILAGTIKNLISIIIVCSMYLSYVKKNRKIVFFSLALAAIIVFFPQLYSLFSQEIITNILAENALNRPRWMLWRTSIDIFKDFFPIGSGFGTFATSVSYSNGYYSDIYNIYGISARYGFRQGEIYFLQDTYWPAVIGETGLIGLLSAGTCLMLLVRLSYGFVKFDTGNTKEIGTVIFLSFCALIIESLFTATMFGIRSYLVISMLGIYCSLCKRKGGVVLK